MHCFFVISGFYMALVLNETYLPSNATYFDFISSRALRLAPAYLTVVATTVLLAIFLAIAGFAVLPPVGGVATLLRAGAGYPLLAINALSQVSFLGQDLFYFLGWTPSAGLEFVSDFRKQPDALYDLAVVPPAWSLSLEFYFYLLAPFVVRRPIFALVFLIAGSVLCRLLLASMLGWRGDPWSYRFFPSELAFFLAGVLAYRLQWKRGPSSGLWIAALALLGTVLGLVDILGVWQPGAPAQRWARVPLFAFLVASIPTLFRWTKDWKADRYVGDLSYPLYVCHCLVIWIAGVVCGSLTTWSGRVLAIVGTVLFAVALQKWVDVPVDRFRHARLRQRLATMQRVASGERPHLGVVAETPTNGLSQQRVR